MTRVFLKLACLAVVATASVFAGAASADWSEDFSGPLTNWDMYTFDPFVPYNTNSISMGVVDGKLEFDAHLPFAGPAGENNNAAGYSAVILNDPAFPDPEDVEISCVVELGGTTDQVYGGILGRAQDVELVSGQILVGGQAYAYLLSGYRDGEAGLYKLQNHADNAVEIIHFDASYDSRIDNEPVYMKMKITSQEGTGYPHVEAMMSFSSDFADPFGIIDYVDDGTDGLTQITGTGQVGLIGFNDFEPNIAMPASVLIDDLLIVTEFVNLGDANGDGFVNSADLDIVRGNWGSSVTPGDAASGDLSGDGLVNSADLDLVRGNWGTVYAAAVPEPGMCVLASLGLLTLAFRFRQK